MCRPALVTNLSVHRVGREASLVWVTSLDKAQPVDAAAVEVRVPWPRLESKTDARGIARIISRCRIPTPSLETGITGICHRPHRWRLQFLFSDWNEGINPAVPPADQQLPDRIWPGVMVTLLRAGDTVHMKRYRQHTRGGFGSSARTACPEAGDSAGSDQKYEQPLVWDEQGIAESLEHPPDARLYQVVSCPAPPAGRRPTDNGPLPTHQRQLPRRAFQCPA